MKKDKLTIVVITYNRIDSLKRLLESLDSATYNEQIDLIVSVDFSGENTIANYLELFRWNHGKKIIIKHSEKMGLKNHVLYCGRLTKTYGNLILFEDDLVVSPNFYSYSKSVITEYGDEENIAGFSLYSHSVNIMNSLRFKPIKQNSDVFLMKYAMSWGQIWMEHHWSLFDEWLEKENDEDFLDEKYPAYLNSWSNNSWLKYHIKYCIDKNLYFVYPYESLSTNFGDKGTHAQINDPTFQVSLKYNLGYEENSSMMLPFQKLLRYDSFFELEYVDNNESINKIDFDIYGEKTIFKKEYILSSQNLPLKIVDSYGLEMRPHELNYFYNIKGNDFFLYENHDKNFLNKKTRNNRKINTLYYYGNFSVKRIILILKQLIKRKIFRK